jgi:hypothetical protein
MMGAQISPEQVRLLTNRARSEEAERQAAEAKALIEPTATQVCKQREVSCDAVNRRSSKDQSCCWWALTVAR